MDTDDWIVLITEMSNELEKAKQFIPNLWSANAVKGYTIKSKWNRFNSYELLLKAIWSVPKWYSTSIRSHK